MLPPLINRIKNRYQIGGLWQVLYKTAEVPLRNLREFFLNCYFKLSPGSLFFFRGCAFRYFKHAYNRAWENERTVEVPLVYELVKRGSRKKILEVGNVLSNYYPSLRHDIVDKYEKAPRVINEDAINFEPKERYDLIVSISTLEHVGWDEDEKDSQKVVALVRRIAGRCLVPGGTFVATMPLGYNPNLDIFLKEKRLGFTHYYYLKRISMENRWEEVPESEVMGIEYGQPFPNTNAVVICIIGPDMFSGIATCKAGVSRGRNRFVE